MSAYNSPKANAYLQFRKEKRALKGAFLRSHSHPAKPDVQLPVGIS